MPENRPVQRAINNVPSTDFVSVYANNLAVSTNFFDVSLIFGEMKGIDDNTLTVEQKVKVVMPPTHAKLVSLLLLQQLQQYQEKFGHITLPPEVVTPELKPWLDLLEASMK